MTGREVKTLDTTQDIRIGQVVKSKAGRDKDRNFIVVNVLDREYVLLADGDLRKIDNPKKKKAKHLAKYNIVSEEINKRILNNEPISNLLLRCELEKLVLK
jgi:ribosomal protein L14E/L6E/L27E